jgi:predicted nucleic acid-binding protein
MSKVFVDTNILVYSMDNHDKKKQSQCRKLLETLRAERLGVISTQVMQEFYVVATRKLGIDPLLAKSILHSFENFETFAVQPETIKEAIDCSITNQVSFGDALVVAAAESAGCDELWTEDLSEGQTIRGVRIVNPLKR